jgi:hypothetical protein
MRLAATVHIDVKLAVAALRLHEQGAEQFLAAASPHTTRHDVRYVGAAGPLVAGAIRESCRIGGTELNLVALQSHR